MPPKSQDNSQKKVWEAILKVLETRDQQGALSVTQLQEALLAELGIATKKQTIYKELIRLRASVWLVRIGRISRRTGPKKSPVNFYYYDTPPQETPKI